MTMQTSTSRILIAALLVAQFVTGATAAEYIKAGGTGTALGLLRQVGSAFAKEGGVAVDVTPSLGSTGAIRALADGVIDVAVSARPLKADEAAAGLREVAVFRTPFVLVTSHADPAGLKASDLLTMFRSDKPVWSDGSPVRPILRPRSETDTALLGAMAPGMAEAIEGARRRPDVPVAATDQDNTKLAASVPGSLTGSTLAQLVTERPDLRVVPLDGVVPTLAKLDDGSYRFAKKLHFILRTNGRPEAERFAAYLSSPAGLKALRDAGALPDRE